MLKAHLKGKWICGQEWRAGNKKRSELISDYRCIVAAYIRSAYICCPCARLRNHPVLQDCHPYCTALYLAMAMSSW